MRETKAISDISRKQLAEWLRDNFENVFSGNEIADRSVLCHVQMLFSLVNQVSSQSTSTISWIQAINFRKRRKVSFRTTLQPVCTCGPGNRGSRFWYKTTNHISLLTDVPREHVVTQLSCLSSLFHTLRCDHLLPWFHVLHVVYAYALTEIFLCYNLFKSVLMTQED